MIGRQCFVESSLPHQHEADGITQGVALVQTCFQQLHSSLVQFFLPPINLNGRVADQLSEKSQRTTTRKTTCLGERYELGEDVAVGEVTSSRSEQCPGSPM